MLILLLTAMVALLAGVASGLLGIGGGIILVPLFHYVLKMNIHAAIGTSLVVIVPTALMGTWRYAAHQNIDWSIFVLAGIFSVLGGLIGASVSVNLDAALLRKIFGVFLLLIAIKMLMQ